MISFLVRIIGNAAALYAAYLLVPGFVVSGGIEQYLIAGLGLAILNMTVRPILKAISFPIIILTLGLFTIVINALMLWILDYFLASLSIGDVMALVWATIIISIVNLIVSVIRKIF
ncbi:MAG TPA: phage holin family protein [Candidatus Paceibacterota bacterium]|nr:phage holin family protein [Candidatus Paceibacterota bacterium]